MPLRCAITRATGQGEQVVIDVAQWNPVTGAIVHESVDEMFALLDQGFQFADVRLEEMNTRMLESYNLIDTLPVADQQRFLSLMDILAGRMSAAEVAMRWQSIKEENEALEQHREAVRLAKLADSELVAVHNESNGEQ